MINIFVILRVKVCLFAGIAGGVFRGGVQTAALALVMVGFGAGGVHIQQALLPQFQAVIHIVIGHGELGFVQAARRAVQLRFGHQAGTRHGHIVLRGDKAVQIAHSLARVALVAVACTAVDAHNHARMLDGIIRVIELCAHSTHIRPLGIAQQLPQKIMAEYLDIVVQQQQMLALGKARTKVVDGRKVKRPHIGHHPAVGVTLRHGFVVGECFLLFRVIFNDQDFKVIIACVGIQAFQAAVQIVNMVFVGDHHADQRVAGQLVPHLERTGRILHLHGFAGQVQPLELGIDRAHTGRQSIGLRLHARCGGTRMAAPDIEHLFDMGNFIPRGLFGQAQHQVMVLCTIVLTGFICTSTVQQCAGEHRQMGDEVDPAQIVRRKVRLKVVATQLFQIRRKHNLIAVHQLGSLALQGFHALIQRVGVQHIVMVQQGDIRPRCQRKACRGVGRNAAVFHFLIQDARILCRGLAGMGAERGMGCVRSIHQHQLPVGVGLLLHAGQHLAKELFRRVVQWHYNAYHRSRLAVCVLGALGFQLPAQGQVCPVLPGIMVERQPHAEGHIAPQLLGTLLFQGGGAAAGKV